MSVPVVDLTYQPFAPDTTPAYRGQLLDQGGNPVPASALTALTLTLVDTVTLAIVNGVSDLNILNTGRGTVDAEGNLVVTLETGDTVLLNAAHAREYRSLILIWTWGANLKGAREVRTMIEALSGS